MVGVRAEQDGRPFRVRARRGVVLGVGGYDMNRELARQFEAMPDWNSACPPHLDGDHLVMAGEIGAALAAVPPTNLAMFYGYNIPGEEHDGKPLFRSSWECGCPHAIWVNRAGERFCDESFYKDYQPRLRRWDGQKQAMPNLPPFLIFDQNYRDRYPLGSFMPGQPLPEELVVQADTPRALAEKLGIDADALRGDARALQPARGARARTPTSARARGPGRCGWWATRTTRTRASARSTSRRSTACDWFRCRSASTRTASRPTPNAQVLHLRGRADPGPLRGGELRGAARHRRRLPERQLEHARDRLGLHRGPTRRRGALNLAEAEYTTTAKLPVERIWDFVEEMDNWARFVTGYQSHEKRSETESLWTLKGDVGVLARRLVFQVDITEWSPGKRAAFRLQGRERADERRGRLHAGGRGGARRPPRAAPPARNALLRLLEAIVRGLLRLARARAAARAPPALAARGHALELPPAARSRRADGAHDQRDDQAADAAGGREPRQPDPRPPRSAARRGAKEPRAMIDYDPFSEEVIRDPYPIYARLREEAPCYHIAKWDAYALSRFEDIWNASMDAESYTTTLGTTSSHLLTKVQPVTPMINLMDPPQHTLLRSRISRFFTPGTVSRLEPQIRGFVEEAWAPLAGAPRRGPLQRLRGQGLRQGRLPRERLPARGQRHAEPHGVALLRARGGRAGDHRRTASRR